MQYIEGETLKTQLETRGKPVAEAVSLIVQLADGLSEAHAMGIIHRDLKPENIMINRRGTPVIMDFGLAKLSTGNSNAAATQAGTILGSPAYMSPEQASGNVKDIDQRSDIYSLGTIFFELLTGQWPFNGSAMQILGQKSLLDPASPLTLKPDLPPQLAAICHKMIAKSNVDRYQSMSEVISDLKQSEALITLPLASPSIETSPAIPNPFPDFTASNPTASVAPRSKVKPAKGGGNSRTTPLVRLQQLASWWNDCPPATKWSALSGAGALLIALGVILFFPTKYGVVQIEIDDPTLAVRFDGDVITVDNDRSPFSVTPTDKHKLEVLQNGVAIKSATKELTIRRGEKRLVTVKLVGDDLVLDGKRLKKPSKVAKAGWQDWPANAPPPAIAPFNSEQAKAHQAAWAKYLGVNVEYTNPIGMKFVLVPPGEFTRGSTVAEIDLALDVASKDVLFPVLKDKGFEQWVKGEAPQHKVILTQPIYIGIHEVTQDQYRRVMGKNSSYHSETGLGRNAVAGLDTSQHPVEDMTWNDAAEFCTKLSEQQQLKPFYFRTESTVTQLEGTGYRLPTEAEWEYSCRAGTATKYWSGDQDEGLARVAWFGPNAGGRTHPVGQLTANPFGIYDILGNVLEQTQDWWEPSYYHQFQGTAARDPTGPPSSAANYRVYRGGEFSSPALFCRTSLRLPTDPSTRAHTLGFRVALPVDAVRLQKNDQPSKVANVGWQGWPVEAPPPAIAPFDATQAKQHQEAWAKYLGIKVIERNSVGMDLVLIPPGSFTMGSPSSEAGRYHNEDQVAVTLTKPIAVGKTEVTQGQWSAVMSTTPWKGMHKILEGTNYPATFVGWKAADEFCSTLSSLEGAKYRLLTDAEWEFACRAGTQTRFSFGEDASLIGQYAWWAENSLNGGEQYPHLVGIKSANPFGLYDMHGNVLEWCQDLHVSKLPGGQDPLVTVGELPQVIRGGCWWAVPPARELRSAMRGPGATVNENDSIGFRIARVLSGTGNREVGAAPFTEEQLGQRIGEYTGKRIDP